MSENVRIRWNVRKIFIRRLIVYVRVSGWGHYYRHLRRHHLHTVFVDGDGWMIFDDDLFAIWPVRRQTLATSMPCFVPIRLAWSRYPEMWLASANPNQSAGQAKNTILFLMQHNSYQLTWMILFCVVFIFCFGRKGQQSAARIWRERECERTPVYYTMYRWALWLQQRPLIITLCMCIVYRFKHNDTRCG